MWFCITEIILGLIICIAVYFKSINDAEELERFIRNMTNEEDS